jgi:hypothetical protein
MADPNALAYYDKLQDVLKHWNMKKDAAWLQQLTLNEKNAEFCRKKKTQHFWSHEKKRKRKFCDLKCEA